MRPGGSLEVPPGRLKMSVAYGMQRFRYLRAVVSRGLSCWASVDSRIVDH